MATNTCPICGKEYDETKMTIGDNGNPICIFCTENKPDVGEFPLQKVQPEIENADGDETVAKKETSITVKRMKCEICGSTNLIKENGGWSCTECSAKYSTEEAKLLLTDVVVETIGITANTMGMQNSETPNDKKAGNEQKTDAIGTAKNNLASLSKKKLMALGGIVALVLVLMIVATTSSTPKYTYNESTDTFVEPAKIAKVISKGTIKLDCEKISDSKYSFSGKAGNEKVTGNIVATYNDGDIISFTVNVDSCDTETCVTLMNQVVDASTSEGTSVKNQINNNLNTYGSTIGTSGFTDELMVGVLFTPYGNDKYSCGITVGRLPSMNK